MYFLTVLFKKKKKKTPLFLESFQFFHILHDHCIIIMFLFVLKGMVSIAMSYNSKQGKISFPFGLTLFPVWALELKVHDSLISRNPQGLHFLVTSQRKHPSLAMLRFFKQGHPAFFSFCPHPHNETR